jgi:hypothetical protein
MCDDWDLCHEQFMYFDMFYIQLHRLAKKDLWNKVYMIITYIYIYDYDYNIAIWLHSSILWHRPAIGY